ncbi:MAG: ROK family protein [Ewingella americana]|uniref:ROK family transcriptional regulator n=1 Tax=Ewingella americana TaxID=41202 RepID=UPI0024302E21|nr:ROK family protein [Ewingella americana]MCI1680082.1 ROK family protein [Ewingella americana]MCI1855077.1 ROK family protein [Ewingella americana]MCI1863554.1 ROK family protein [Ewingella americana]MCI2143424.1 ROK family protein [Ewingella americana]MCI2164581.1 ROK family protein [Ewingella americana]
MKDSGKGPALLRHYNEKRVLAYLRQQKISSRLDISRALALSKNTISLIVDDLLALGYVEEQGVAQTSSIGRPKIHVALKPSAIKAAGIMIERHRLHWMVCDYFSDIIASQTHSLDTSDPQQVLVTIASYCQQLQQEYPELVGIGVGFPGIVEQQAGILHVSSHLGWGEVSLQPLLSGSTSAPVAVWNNVKAAALIARQGEISSEDEICFYLRIGEGIGGALLTEHGVYSGGSWTAGEVGHLSVFPDGPLCSCGQHGCLESLISFSAINRQLEQQQSGLSWDNRQSAPETVNQVMAQAGELLGKALSQIIHLVNPKTLLIDCPYNEHPLFIEHTLAAAKKLTLTFPFSRTHITFVSERLNPAQGLALAMIQRFEQVSLA